MLSLALLALTCQSTPGGPPPRPRDRAAELKRLVEFEDELGAALLTARPWLASVGDDADRAPELGWIAPGDHDAWVQDLRDLESSIAAIDEGNLPGLRGHDATWLASWVRQERILMATLKPQLYSPWHYVESVHLSLAAAARPAASGVLTTVRIRNLAERIKRVPAIWTEAQRYLEDLSQPLCRQSADRAAELARAIRDTYRPLAESLPAEEREAFGATCDRAQHGTEAFVAWLEERVAVTARAPRFLLKGTHWKQLIEYATGWSVDFDELPLMLLKEISTRRADVGKHAHAIEVPDAALFPARIEAKIVEFADDLASRASELGLLPATRPDFEVHARVSPGGTLDSPRWERPALDRWRLVLTLPNSASSEAAQLTRRDQLSAATRPALATRYGPLGETLMMRSAMSSGSKSRIQVPSLPRRTAFGLYALDWTLRIGVFETRDERVRALFEREILIEAARLLAAVEMYGGLNDHDTAIDHFVAHTGLDRETAAWEVHQTAIDPLHGCAFLFYLDTLELERSFAEHCDERDAVRQTVRLLLSHTSAAVRDLER